MKNFLKIQIVLAIYLLYVCFILNQTEHRGRLFRMIISAVLSYIFLQNKYSSFTKLYISLYTVYILFSIILFESCLKMNSTGGQILMCNLILIQNILQKLSLLDKKYKMLIQIISQLYYFLRIYFYNNRKINLFNDKNYAPSILTFILL